jgi:predicted cupin superfamily sugar epimerase
MKTKEYWIKILNLKPHPEGGFYNEIYRSDEFIKKQCLDERFKGDRVFYTSIHFLIDNDNISKFHKVMADEIWHFHTGSALRLHFIDQNGIYESVKIGLNAENGEKLTHTVKHQTWMAAEVINKQDYSLVGCTTAPGFEFEDFVMADRNELFNLSPNNKRIIEIFT